MIIVHLYGTCTGNRQIKSKNQKADNYIYLTRKMLVITFQQFTYLNLSKRKLNSSLFNLAKMKNVTVQLEVVTGFTVCDSYLVAVDCRPRALKQTVVVTITMT